VPLRGRLPGWETAQRTSQPPTERTAYEGFRVKRTGASSPGPVRRRAMRRTLYLWMFSGGTIFPLAISALY
jgi:hypothetical protein